MFVCPWCFFVCIGSGVTPCDGAVVGPDTIIVVSGSGEKTTSASVHAGMESSQANTIGTLLLFALDAQMAVLNSTYNLLTRSSMYDMHSAARTKVVSDIIARVVEPILHNVPVKARVRGILLCGPPGVGKSYAVKAVRRLCADRMEVRTVSLHQYHLTICAR
jgi:hypothetical protein